jgi:HSP20 family molecular chaperone IbpA
MADTQSKELKVREKQEVTSLAEQTTPGLVFTPAVDIFETEKDITLLADMPGVKSDDLTIDLRDNTLTLAADIAPDDDGDEETTAGITGSLRSVN